MDASLPDANFRTKDMVWIPGATFVMGSDRHYPEEAPAHKVTVDGFNVAGLVQGRERSSR